MFHNNYAAERQISPHGTFQHVRAPQWSALRPSVSLCDRQYIAEWERRIRDRVEPTRKCKNLSISSARRDMRSLVLYILNLKTLERDLSRRVGSIGEEEWSRAFCEVNTMRSEINRMLSRVDDAYLHKLQCALTRRATRRARLRTRRSRIAELRAETERRRRDTERRIDDNLLQLHRRLLHAQQVEREALSADVFLREVLRRKHDARRCVDKLEALARLRRARRTSATGRGQHTSQAEADLFTSNIEKLLVMWRNKLMSYDSEETELRRRLAPADTTPTYPASPADASAAWRAIMFGDESALPQRDFRGDMSSFIAVRCAWDVYVHEAGSAVPLGWLLPSAAYTPPADNSSHV